MWATGPMLSSRTSLKISFAGCRSTDHPLWKCEILNCLRPTSSLELIPTSFSLDLSISLPIWQIQGRSIAWDQGDYGSDWNWRTKRSSWRRWVNRWVSHFDSLTVFFYGTHLDITWTGETVRYVIKQPLRTLNPNTALMKVREWPGFWENALRIHQ